MRLSSSSIVFEPASLSASHTTSSTSPRTRLLAVMPLPVSFEASPPVPVGDCPRQRDHSEKGLWRRAVEGGTGSPARDSLGRASGCQRHAHLHPATTNSGVTGQRCAAPFPRRCSPPPSPLRPPPPSSAAATSRPGPALAFLAARILPRGDRLAPKAVLSQTNDGTGPSPENCFTR
ncbi:hypothetical protein HMN09_01235700 [Mycena chlorophos]|uniref:Uncharacterized protein n=1 Tax=Mycena chlorophos TaxID=658473 RepID=A0A8H6S491_MYCCL|nr:hypothetical protein HMN09_01235700 [Mycena chlorophos]